MNFYAIYGRLLRALCLGAIATATVLMGLSSARADETLRIVHSSSPQTFQIPHYLAIDKGWYKERGLTIQDIYLTDSGNALRALLSGDGDVAVLGATSTMQAILSGVKVKVIGSWQPRVDYIVITAKSATDKMGPGLVGLKFAGGGGVGMLNHIFAMVLKKHGLDSTKNESVAIGGHSDRLAALIAGKTQVTLVNTLTAVRAGNQVNVITATHKELGNIAYVYLVVTEKDLANPAKRQAFTAFMRGSILGARYTVDHPAEAAAALNKRVPELKVDLIQEVVKQLNEIPLWGINGGIEPEITDFTVQAFLEYKEISKPLKTEQVLDRTIVDPIIKELGEWKKKN